MLPRIKVLAPKKPAQCKEEDEDVAMEEGEELEVCFHT